MNLYERWVRPLLFRLDPESAHELTVGLLERLSFLPGARTALETAFRVEHPALETEVAGLRFPNPVGLAAGFDKDCLLVGILPALGFGFIEVGTITPKPQPGNPRPRLWRIPESEALMNRLGFNSRGLAHAADRLAALRGRSVPLGINLGINADTLADDAPREYARLYEALLPYGDYFVVNVSSPNTRGLRELQDRLRLERILTAMRSVRIVDPSTGRLGRPVRPIFVKLAPDLHPEALAGLLSLLCQEADGVVVSNTTLSRAGVPEQFADTRGGLSGAPLRDMSTELISRIHSMSEGKLPIIGVGGIFSAEDAYQKLRAGASLVQVYTGLVYRGPGLVREINEGLLDILRSHGFGSIRDAVGLTRPPARAADAPTPILK